MIRAASAALLAPLLAALLLSPTAVAHSQSVKPSDSLVVQLPDLSKLSAAIVADSKANEVTPARRAPTRPVSPPATPAAPATTVAVPASLATKPAVAAPAVASPAARTTVEGPPPSTSASRPPLLASLAGAAILGALLFGAGVHVGRTPQHAPVQSAAQSRAQPPDQQRTAQPEDRGGLFARFSRKSAPRQQISGMIPKKRQPRGVGGSSSNGHTDHVHQDG